MALLVILNGIHNNIVIMCVKLGDRVGVETLSRSLHFTPHGYAMPSYASFHILCYNYAYGSGRTRFIGTGMAPGPSETGVHFVDVDGKRK